MSTPEQRAAWRELAAAATGGVWRTGPSRYNVIASGKGNGKIATMDGDDGDKLFNNAAFIAAARAAVPQLLADVDALQAERDALAAELATVREAANVEWQAEHAARLVAEERLKAATVRADALQLELDCID